MPEVEVSQLNYYPIKSCAGTSVEEATLADTGLQYDRQWMLVDAKGQFLSQRKNPELALVRPFITDDSLIVTAPKMPDLEIPLAVNFAVPEDLAQVTVWKKSGMGASEGDRPVDWFSKYLGAYTKLLRIYHSRFIKYECRVNGATDQIAFADGFPLLLTTEQSLAELNRHLEQLVPMNRFRPNIVVSGNYLPAYDEDYWREIIIGQLGAHVVRACSRCRIPDTDQATGLRETGNPVTRALQATRHGRDRVDDSLGNFFGQNLTYDLGGASTIRVGDKVQVVCRALNRNFTAAE